VKRSDLDTVTVLGIIAGKEPDGPKVTSLIAARYPQAPEKVIVAKLYQLSSQRLIDYGVSVSYPWLTDAGRQKLAETGR
jgi:hypothetical protein